MVAVGLAKLIRFTPSKQLKTKSKQDLKHSNTEVRFVRQIIDGPDRVRGVKEICFYSKNWPGSVMGTGLIVLEKWEFSPCLCYYSCLLDLKKDCTG